MYRKSHELLKRMTNIVQRQEGYSHVEALVTMVIIGVFGTGLVGGLLTATKTTPLTDEISTAQSLAENQLEYVRTQDYDYINNPPQYLVLSGTAVPDGYSITNTATHLDPEEDGSTDDDGIQNITVTVKHWNKTVTSIDSYRIRR